MLGASSERHGQLPARVDAELEIDVAEVVLDRLRAEEHRGRSLSRGLARGEQQGDLKLLRCELVDRARIPPPNRLTRRRQLGAGPLAPQTGVEPLKRLQRSAKLL